MTDFNTCRKNMVDCQLITNGINDEDLLSVYRHLPREKFFSKKHAANAYVDEDVTCGAGLNMLEPMIEAKMLQSAGIEKRSIILVLGAGAACLAAAAAQLSQTVFLVDSSKKQITQLSKTFLDLNVGNVVCEQGTVCDGLSKHGPYDAIFMGGACSSVSEELLAQLKDGGCLVSPVRENSISPSSVVKYTRRGKESLQEVICQSNTPYLKGFEAEKGFVF